MNYQVFFEYVYHGCDTLKIRKQMDKISARLYLDRLLVQILLRAGDEVRSHDPALLFTGSSQIAVAEVRHS